MAKKRPSSAADYAEIVIERRSQPALQGEMWVVDGLLTVTSSDGRQKTTQVGNARPAGLARLYLESRKIHTGDLGVCGNGPVRRHDQQINGRKENRANC